MLETKHSRYKLLLVEPSAIVAKGIKSLLTEVGEYESIATYPDFDQCQDKLTVLKPDVVLVNPSVFDYQKRHSVRNIYPELQQTTLVAIVYGLMEEELLRQYDGTITLYETPSQLVRKLRKAIEQKHQTPGTHDGHELSTREKEILKSVALGLTNKEIADRHHISAYTVMSHRKNITRKTGIKTVSGLTIYALLNHLIDQNDLE